MATSTAERWRQIDVDTIRASETGGAGAGEGAADSLQNVSGPYRALKRTLAQGRLVKLSVLPREGVRRSAWTVYGIVLKNNAAGIIVGFYRSDKYLDYVKFMDVQVIPMRYFDEGRVLHVAGP